MALPATSSVTHYGGNPFVELFLHGHSRTTDLYQMAVSLDSFSALLATVFVIINLMKPEIHDQSLMPALQSIWFIPHVTVYMFSYSVLGCAFIIALTGLFRHKEEYLHTADNLVYAGIAFLSIGMLLGSLWAKEAWGNYWSWDPKETWAVITWAGYLLYVHLRLFRKTGRKTLYVLLIMSFLALQMCWYGVNYLPAAQQSVHYIIVITNLKKQM